MTTLRPSSAATAVAIGIAAVAVAALGRLAIGPLVGLGYPFLTMYPAVMAAAWAGGFVSGIVATVVGSATAAYFWMIPVGSPIPQTTADWVGSLAFVVIGVGISVAHEGLRRAKTAEQSMRASAEQARSAAVAAQRRINELVATVPGVV